ncbi:MAG TPA: hypothetical protein VFU49_12630 [Ktedonobacteraceae bacterium]|nr:hypothetical protein [Ktedonobacteraceae bacterium]
MNWMTRTRRWSILVLTTLLLLLSLTVVACGQASQQGSSNGSYSTSQQNASQQGTSQQSTSQGDDATQIQNADQDVQSQIQSLDKAQNDVNNSSSLQDDGQLP